VETHRDDDVEADGSHGEEVETTDGEEDDTGTVKFARMPDTDDSRL
jgi:hypothetical protein